MLKSKIRIKAVFLVIVLFNGKHDLFKAHSFTRENSLRYFVLRKGFAK